MLYIWMSLQRHSVHIHGPLALPFDVPLPTTTGTSTDQLITAWTCGPTVYHHGDVHGSAHHSLDMWSYCLPPRGRPRISSSQPGHVVLLSTTTGTSTDQLITAWTCGPTVYHHGDVHGSAHHSLDMWSYCLPPRGRPRISSSQPGHAVLLSTTTGTSTDQLITAWTCGPILSTWSYTVYVDLLSTWPYTVYVVLYCLRGPTVYVALYCLRGPILSTWTYCLRGPILSTWSYTVYVVLYCLRGPTVYVVLYCLRGPTVYVVLLSTWPYTVYVVLLCTWSYTVYVVLYCVRGPTVYVVLLSTWSYYLHTMIHPQHVVPCSSSTFKSSMNFISQLMSMGFTIRVKDRLIPESWNGK